MTEWLDKFLGELSPGSRLVSSADELDKAVDHIVALLRDATTLYAAQGFARACFLALTAIEETAKAHVGMHFSAEGQPRRKNPLFSHKKKHQLAAVPTVGMGSRLNGVLGNEQVADVLAQFRGGDLIALRESCLYFEKKADKLYVPEDAISREAARKYLLVAIEVFDDALVGYTSHSMEVGRITDEMFSALIEGEAGA